MTKTHIKNYNLNLSIPFVPPNEDAELDVASVEVKDKSENKGSVVLKLVSSGCVAVVLIIIFCPAFVYPLGAVIVN